MKSPTIFQVSSVGTRDINEDRVGHWSSHETVLMAVADGLGGHMHGELAAQIAVDILGAAFAAEAHDRLPDPASFLARSLATAHAAILRESTKRRYPDSPRTVIAVCVVQDGQVFWTHVGDCRFYLLRDGGIHVRTRDHTVVQRLVDEGRIREDAAASHPYRNRLLQCLGGVTTPAIEPVSCERLAKDDVILLCSDGFWGPLPSRELVHGLTFHPPAVALPELVKLAEEFAGPDCDNISAIAMSWNRVA